MLIKVLSLLLLSGSMNNMDDKGAKIYTVTLDRMHKACPVKTNVYVPLDRPQISHYNLG